jgi:AAA ATPase domain
MKVANIADREKVTKKIEKAKLFENPFRPGAGHMPPYLAGREEEQSEFTRLLQQDPILQNMVLTGLRGVGKTVLLETFRPIALRENWGWVGTDLSESASLSEERMAIRLITDLAVLASNVTVPVTKRGAGFSEVKQTRQPLTFAVLMKTFTDTPGLISDKLKHVLELVWGALPNYGTRGIVFAYDEAQNLSDYAEKDQYPLSLLLDVFQSIQRKGVRFLLVLTGLPTLFPKLVEARTYSERMFHVVSLSQLNHEDSRQAILVPTQQPGCPFSPADKSVDTIIDITGGYPYFIQFVCRELYAIWVQHPHASIPGNALIAKLDSDFFAGRWAKATDRQRDLLSVVASLPTCDGEFTVQEIVVRSKKFLPKAFSSSHVNQMLTSLGEAGLVYRNRYGKYSFAVPLLGQFIARQMQEEEVD